MNKLEKATASNQSDVMRIGYALLFMVGIILYIGAQAADIPGGFTLIVAAVVGGYMAMNIGANDVANNVGPAVGSKALSMTGAIIIAAIFEASGALIAGGDVVSTISKGIINPAAIGDADTLYLVNACSTFSWRALAEPCNCCWCSSIYNALNCWRCTRCWYCRWRIWNRKLGPDERHCG